MLRLTGRGKCTRSGGRKRALVLSSLPILTLVALIGCGGQTKPEAARPAVETGSQLLETSQLRRDVEALIESGKPSAIVFYAELSACCDAARLEYTELRGEGLRLLQELSEECGTLFIDLGTLESADRTYLTSIMTRFSVKNLNTVLLLDSQARAVGIIEAPFSVSAVKEILRQATRG